MSENQRWDPERYRRIAGFVSELGVPLLELLDARPGERILDLGCGDGALTQQLLARGCEVVGIDSSAEQVAAARARGFQVRSIRLFARPTPIDSGLGEWLGVFAQSFLSAAPADEREDLVREVCDAAAPRLQRADGAWVVDYVRLRVAALRPAG